mgnify:CR=1 FL=1
MTFPLAKNDAVSLSEILTYSDSVNWVLGASRTGKTTFLSKLIYTLPQDKKIFLLDTAGKFVENDLSKIDSVEVLPENSQLSEDTLEKLPPKSFVIVDDFQLVTKPSQWQRVVNYCAHHFHLSIFLVVHSHQNTEGLHYALKNACNLYLTYSSNSKYFLSSLAKGKYLIFFNNYWKEGLEGRHICFINTNHSIIINFIDKLLQKQVSSPVLAAEMADVANRHLLGEMEEKRWSITNLSSNDNHTMQQPLPGQDLEPFFEKELRLTYTNKKQFPKMFKITRCLLSKGVLNADQLILGKVNLMDFLAFTQRFAQKQVTSASDSSNESGSDNSQHPSENFGFVNKNLIKKKNKSKHYNKENKKWKKLCIKLKEHGVVIPITLMKNPKAKSYFK